MSDDEQHMQPESTGENQVVDPRSKGWFKPGQSGNPAGKPKGARDKLDRTFVRALYRDFKENGIEAIIKTRQEKPDAYLNVIAKVLPKEIKGDVNVTLNHEKALDELE